MNTPTAWCPTCRRRRTVIDRHDESVYEGGSAFAWERHFIVEELSCGHDNVATTGITNTAPGGGSADLPRSYALGRDPWAQED